MAFEGVREANQEMRARGTAQDIMILFIRLTIQDEAFNNYKSFFSIFRLVERSNTCSSCLSYLMNAMPTS